MRSNRTITVGAAPINVITGTTSAPPVSSAPVYASRVFVQMLATGSGMGYVLDGVNVGRVPAIAVDNDVTAQLAPAEASAPGGAYSDQATSMEDLIDLRLIWVHGANATDKIKVSANEVV